jgi:hypothetical protein
MQLVGGPGIELEVAHDGRRVGARLLHGLAAVAAFQLGQFFLVILQLVGQLHQQAAALGGESLPQAPS